MEIGYYMNPWNRLIGRLFFAGGMLLYFMLIQVHAAAYQKDSRDDDSTGSFEKFLQRIAESQRNMENKSIFAVKSGYMQPSFPPGEFSDPLARSIPAEIEYGFLRINDKLDIEDIFSFSSEFISLTNLSSHLKPRSIANHGITTDNWRFSAGMDNGFGYRIGDSRLFLYHTGALSLNRIDFEIDASNEHDREIIKKMDVKYKFGTFFSGGLRYSLTPSVLAEVGYEHMLVFPDYNFWSWFGGWMIDNLAQRTIDFFEDDLMKYHGRDYPWVKFIYRNAVSLILYEFRRSQSFWPFESEAPLSYDGVKIGFTIVF